MSAVQVAIVDAGDVVHRYTTQPSGGSIRTGVVWGPAADGSDEWFGYRQDVDGGEPRRLPSREAAVKWLEVIAP